MKVLAIALISTLNLWAANPIANPEPKAGKSTKKIEKTANQNDPKIRELLLAYQNNTQDKNALKVLRESTMVLSNKAVPVLIEVMKKDSYPEQNRWIATFLLGQIMGVKASPFIAKFTSHPNWMMRLASLKTLTALKNTTYLKVYSELLKDNSAIVRAQALDSIKTLKLTKLAPSVWNMLYDKRNYNSTAGKNKRDEIIKKVILAMGDLDFKTIEPSLLKMAANSKFSDVFEEIDYSLVKISGKKSPTGGIEKKRHFWKKLEVSKVSI